MDKKNMGFKGYLNKEIENTKGIYVPIRAGFLRRLLIKRTNRKKLHPNPDDEFCSPKIGPNADIISKYCLLYQRHGTYSSVSFNSEPLIVEKIRPDGYLILNGHHRWAAAVITGQRSLPIRIVDLPMEKDIQRMLRHSHNDRRVTLDLEEVVFRCEGDAPVEKLPFFLRLRYKQRLRLGIPALFRFFNEKGYDIWVYSSNYYSFRQIRALFMLYHTRVTGIVTGTARKGSASAKQWDPVKKNVSEHYSTTIHIDNRALLRVNSDAGDYDEYPIDGADSQWSAKIMGLIGALDKNGK